MNRNSLCRVRTGNPGSGSDVPAVFALPGALVVASTRKHIEEVSSGTPGNTNASSFSPPTDKPEPIWRRSALSANPDFLSDLNQATGKQHRPEEEGFEKDHPSEPLSKSADQWRRFPPSRKTLNQYY
jgi:hypothetical protein